jgi:hypothetical protein
MLSFDKLHGTYIYLIFKVIILLFDAFVLTVHQFLIVSD